MYTFRTAQLEVPANLGPLDLRDQLVLTESQEAMELQDLMVGHQLSGLLYDLTLRCSRSARITI